MLSECALIIGRAEADGRETAEEVSRRRANYSSRQHQIRQINLVKLPDSG